MIIKEEKFIGNFEAWNGGEKVIEHVKNHDLLTELDNLIEDMYPDGIAEDDLNDYLMACAENIYDALGIKSPEEELADEVTEAFDPILQKLEDLSFEHLESQIEVFIEDVESYFEEYEGTDEEKTEDFVNLYTKDLEDVRKLISDFRKDFASALEDYNKEMEYYSDYKEDNYEKDTVSDYIVSFPQRIEALEKRVDEIEQEYKAEPKERDAEHDDR